ncbi:hypothetical protein ACP4OV_031492 [Aristida adscensionis]
MAAPPETLILGALIVLYLLLAAAALYFRARRLLRARGARLRERQRRCDPPPAPREPPAAPGEEGEGEAEAEEEDGEGGREKQQQQQRRRRRARRKRQQQGEEEGEGDGGGQDAAAAAGREGRGRGEGESLLPPRPQFPLALVAGALQRRINEQYDDLARASEASCLTIEQVRNTGKKGRQATRKPLPEQPPVPLSMVSSAMKRRIREIYAGLSSKITEDLLVNEFINCLKDARNELLQRYVNVQRSVKIKKAMLSNPRNYRSSYERLFEQVCRLETERNNLRKDAAIYNYVQERLLASAPYKLIMELSSMEMEAPEISFEELLAREKEDTAFWQRNGKMRSISSK